MFWGRKGEMKSFLNNVVSLLSFSLLLSYYLLHVIVIHQTIFHYFLWSKYILLRSSNISLTQDLESWNILLKRNLFRPKKHKVHNQTQSLSFSSYINLFTLIANKILEIWNHSSSCRLLKENLFVTRTGMLSNAF